MSRASSSLLQGELTVMGRQPEGAEAWLIRCDWFSMRAKLCKTIFHNRVKPFLQFHTDRLMTACQSVTISWSFMSFPLHFTSWCPLSLRLVLSHSLSVIHLSILMWHFISQFIEFYLSPGSWVRWQSWQSVRSWWREWWSPGQFAQRGLTRFGYARTGRGQQC